MVRAYTYGLDLISQRQLILSTWNYSYYGYDGHSSVRSLTDSSGSVTDAYTYDAFGNLIERTGSTPNNYLYSGEQFDPDLGLYYNRARYLDVRSGRFWGMDAYEGDPGSPVSLHKYLYTGGNPVDHRDVSGNEFDLGSTLAASGISTTIFSLSVLQSQAVIGAVAGGLFAASFAGFGSYLEGGSPEQIESATGNVWNISLGMLLGAGGSYVLAFRAGKIALMLAALGIGGSNAARSYYEGHTGAAVYYTVLALGGTFLINLAKPTPTAPATAPPASTTVTNPLPATVARIIPADANPSTLGLPGESDVFVTDAAAIRGMSASQIQQTLNIQPSSAYIVIEYPTPYGIASPIGRTNPGFLQGGLTTGTPQVPEYVVPNGPIPPSATISIVK